ncbi:MAG: hypothetical protein LBP95_09835 [Deltaproteobacteria bacterium]|jgi:hypothetical protein|nr:hypothetical protein [Deltaproteobacteria bacterium]
MRNLLSIRGLAVFLVALAVCLGAVHHFADLSGTGRMKNTPMGDPLTTSSYAVAGTGYAGFLELLDKAGPGVDRKHRDNPYDHETPKFYILPRARSLAELKNVSDSVAPGSALLVILPKWDFWRHPSSWSWTSALALRSLRDINDDLAELVDPARAPGPDGSGGDMPDEDWGPPAPGPDGSGGDMPDDDGAPPAPGPRRAALGGPKATPGFGAAAAVLDDAPGSPGAPDDADPEYLGGGDDVFIRRPWPGAGGLETPFPGPPPAPLAGPARPGGLLGGEEEPDEEVFRPLMQLAAAGSAPGESVVGTAQGALVLRQTRGGRTVYFLADPDVVDNMGLAAGDNALFALRLMRHLAGLEGLDGRMVFLENEFYDPALAVEESGFWLTPTKLPMSLIVVFAALSGAAALLALAERFGGPAVTGSGRVFGKAKLIDNSAGLLARPRLAPAVADSYVKMIVARAAKTLHAPRNLSESELRAFLIRAGRGRGGGVVPALLAPRTGAGTNNQELFAGVRQIHRWFKEL